MDSSALRQDVEKTLWILSEWRVEQSDVDTVMAKVDAYAAAASGTDFAPVCAMTFDDLPEDERKRITDAGIRACADSYVQGVEAGKKTGLAGLADAVRIPAQRVAPEGMRTCRVCREIKVLAKDFRTEARSPEGYRSECKRCEAAAKVRRRTAQKAS